MFGIEIYNNLKNIIEKQFPTLYVEHFLYPENQERSFNGRFIANFQNFSFITIYSTTYSDEHLYESLIAVLAHEFGHFCCYKNISDDEYILRTNAYKKYTLQQPLLKKHKEIIIKEETEAWNYGFEFLKNNNIPISKTIQEQKDISIKSHANCLDLLCMSLLLYLFYSLNEKIEKWFKI